jgi:D-glycero-D-manno-heptose 1,7-bisphosphate phosphatase
MTGGKRRAVFLDRDGTINVEKDYLHRIEDFAFIPGAPQAIRALREAGFMVIVVTNQSGVARGLYSEKDVERLHRFIQEELAACGTAIDAFYFCPHHPEHGQDQYRVACDCRKGAPGMLLQAAREHDIDLARSYMVGDKPADIEAGRQAGCRCIMVMTGYGSTAACHPDLALIRACPDLASAAALIIRETGQ